MLKGGDKLIIKEKVKFIDLVFGGFNLYENEQYRVLIPASEPDMIKLVELSGETSNGNNWGDAWLIQNTDEQVEQLLEAAYLCR